MELRVKPARSSLFMMFISIAGGIMKRDSITDSRLVGTNLALPANTLGGVPVNMHGSPIWELLNPTDLPDKYH
jgi:hypothetical protein